MTTSKQKICNKLLTLQLTRGVASLFVALHHASNSIKVALSMPVRPFGAFFQFGHAGVDFFFVLSGFIIFHVHRKDINQPNRLSEFAWKRVTRIYPIFWFVMIIVTMKFVELGNFEWVFFLKTIFLFPQPPFPMLVQSWTLVHEQIFYFIFGLTIFNLRLAIYITVLWLCALVGSIIFGSPHDGIVGDIVGTFLSTYNLDFLIGISVAWLTLDGRFCNPWPALIFGLVAFTAIAVADDYQYFSHAYNTGILLYGGASGIILFGLVTAETRGLIRLGNWAEVIGDVSYPLYLVHGIVISVVTSILSKFFSAKELPASVILIAAVISACIAAYLLNRLVEKPIARLLKQYWKERHNRLAEN